MNDYNPKEVSERIKQRAKERGIVLKNMLEECGSSVNGLAQGSSKKGIGSFTIARIADYLECSVDYLLGRAETPTPEVNFNQSLTFYLEKYRRTPEELATAIGVDLTTVGKWLNFENKIPSEYILPICKFFGIAYFDFSRQDPKTGELLKIEQKPTIENSSNVEVTGIKYNATIQRSELDSQATTKALLKEIEKVLDRLSAREQMKLMTIIYDYEDDCKKNNS